MTTEETLYIEEDIEAINAPKFKLQNTKNGTKLFGSITNLKNILKEDFNRRIQEEKFRNVLLDSLKKEGYIKDYFIEKTENNKTSLKISLKYYEGDPVIKEIKRISKPGRRVYSRANSIPKVMNGLGLAILSTPKGVMSDTEARKNNVGGEVICRVF